MLFRAIVASILFTALTLPFPASVRAAAEPEVQVSRSGGSLLANAEFVVDAPRPEVVRAFTAFDRLADLNPAIVASHAEVLDSGQVRVTTRLSDCVLLFCKSVTLVERVSILASGDMRSEIEAAGSDFRQGASSWTFVARGSQTVVSYQSRMQPDFWLPPLLGRQAMQSALKRQVAASIETLERRHSKGDECVSVLSGEFAE